MVERTCHTCRHGTLPFGQQPCSDCLYNTTHRNLPAFSKWEPKKEKENENGNTENT